MPSVLVHPTNFLPGCRVLDWDCLKGTDYVMHYTSRVKRRWAICEKEKKIQQKGKGVLLVFCFHSSSNWYPGSSVG